LLSRIVTFSLDIKGVVTIMTEKTMKRTVLYESHKALGAKLVEFAGWEMPLSYTGVLEEHEAVRTAGGLFDVSHMGRIVVRGGNSRAFLDWIVPSDVGKLRPGAALYTVFCNESGGILDDLFVYKRSRSEFLLCVNASNREKCLRWMNASKDRFHVEVEDQSDLMAQIALQGPESLNLLQQMLDLNVPERVKGELETLPVRSFLECPFRGMDALIARTGFSGERGYELFIPYLIAPGLWDSLLAIGKDKGIRPAGLGARDTLRLEMGYLLYGSDMDEQTLPWECGLDRVIDLEKGDFIGREVLQRKKAEGIKRKLVGFEILQKGIPRHGCRIFSEGKAIGVVTSGNFSPSLRRGIGLGYLEPAFSDVGSEILIDVRGKAVPAVVVDLPIYKKKKG
jgi:aminomethyltransferase